MTTTNIVLFFDRLYNVAIRFILPVIISIGTSLLLRSWLSVSCIIYTFTQQNKQTIKQKTNKTKRKQKPKTKNYLAQNQVKTMHLNSNSSISEMVCIEWEIF
jgi:mannitol-specific phosphotransferase system IIBC component